MLKAVSSATIERLPLYLRFLRVLDENGRDVVSSIEFAEMFDITPEQVRRDLSDVNQFGIKGVGYQVKGLRRGIEKVLGLQYRWSLAVVGAGEFGRAFIESKHFPEYNFNVTAIFEVDKNLIGKRINGVKVYDFANLNAVAGSKVIDIGVIAVPSDKAQDVANALIEAGIKGILNFAPKKIEVPFGIHLVNADLLIRLTTLTYHLSQE